MCCDNPEYTSSTYSDQCLNCGCYVNYMTGEEGYDYSYNEQEEVEHD